MVALILGGCTTTEKKWDSPILAVISDLEDVTLPPTDQKKDYVAEALRQNQSVDSTIPSPLIEQPYIESIQQEQRFENGWIVLRKNDLSLEELIAKAKKYKVTQIQMGGDILAAVDELIFDQTKRDYIQQAAREMESLDIESLVWSHEIYLDSKTFIFHKDAPLVAARQAAYRNALKAIPELDGVVLTFSDAMLPVWDAESPASQTLSPVERIRFIVDMVRNVVVDELNKKLYIYVDTNELERVAWISDALSGLPRDDIDIILSSQTDDISIDGFNHQTSKFQNFNRLMKIDPAGSIFGGPEFLVGFWSDWERWNFLRNQENIQGVVTIVNGQQGSIFNSPNEINLMALANDIAGVSIDPNILAEQWCKEKYNIEPLTREGQVLCQILRNSSLWSAKIGMVKNILFLASQGNLPSIDQFKFPSQSDWGLGHDQEIQQYLAILKNPDKQVLTDLAQESVEASELLDKAIWELESIRDYLKPIDFNDLHQRLERQRFVSDIFHYAKQVIWGFDLWKRTYDEDEALHLEAHLQTLERLTMILETRYQNQLTSIKSETVRQWISLIRSDFPRVIIGWKERDWNQIKDIVIRQSGPQSIEIKWNSEVPSTSRIFISTALPNFERMLPVETYPEMQHLVQVNEIASGKRYIIKIQSISQNGQITNSGEFFFKIETPPEI